MKEFIIKKSNEYYNENLVSINHENILSLNINKDRSYFYFCKKPNIEINNYKENIRYILGLSSITFQFWDMSPQKVYTNYSNNGHIGFLALYEGYNKLYNNIILSNKKIDIITHEDMRSFFGSIPNLHGRIMILKESLNKTLFELAYEVIMNDVNKNNLIDTTTAQKISDIMPKSFSDLFLNKIQFALFEIYEILKFKYPQLNISLTSGSNGEISKVLNYLEIINYNDEIKNKISNKVLLSENSLEELAIRSSSVLAFEEISKIHKIPLMYLNKYFLEQRNNTKNNFHLTKTTNY